MSGASDPRGGHADGGLLAHLDRDGIVRLHAEMVEVRPSALLLLAGLATGPSAAAAPYPPILKPVMATALARSSARNAAATGVITKSAASPERSRSLIRTSPSCPADIDEMTVGASANSSGVGIPGRFSRAVVRSFQAMSGVYLGIGVVLLGLHLAKRQAAGQRRQARPAPGPLAMGGAA